MKSALFLIGGVALGFAAAHIINSTERGRAVFGRVNERVDEFVGAVKDGYNARTDELLDAIDR
ncbi:hypothetical protein GCM10011490_04090 [Pseudoclavibacter endophyticus]|uniref:YtxH domain-containing protein n=1 Tax=Pseudoclavibacter endophyticus TaxID=1778590 RepID=A0A6H9WUB7_9MICO|nr:hypothetical protein [Pseudoclavibacter endophyticus]KAB1650074.1 hypothetical protein F8O04_07675 [Pseudoclavibacter endophyticus]GGA57492.1 hypothetical protein GCM10011490_04090 [Pseudoclavibacter endophyticus]